jgi:predicted ATPase/DNA-binding SARP family transcriptional activator
VAERPTGRAEPSTLVKVLGPTVAETDGCPVDLGGPLARRLLTALVAARGRSVSDERLADFLWGAVQPAQAIAALRAYVSRLRRALGQPGRSALRRQGCGYVLHLAPEATDTGRFVRGLERGRELAAAGRSSEAVGALTEALAMWRGDPFADLDDVREFAPARAELIGLRERAVEERLAALLASGDHLGAVGELETAVRRDPYREHLWELLVLGLCRAGRKPEALAALRRARAQLAVDLGIEPGPKLRELERQVLGQDPDLTTGTSTDPPRVRTRWPLTSFVGRERDLATLAAGVRDHRLVTVVGPAGVGKTRLAVEYLATRDDVHGPWLVRLADVGQPAALVPAVASAVGTADLTGDPHQTLIRALGARQGLLVLDNCEHLVEPVAELAQLLLERCPELRILTTSRESLALDGEVLLPAAPLRTHTDDDTEPEAVTLFLDRVRAMLPGWSPSPADHRVARQVCVALDGLPLAIELAAARARVMSLAEIGQRLDDRFSLLAAVPRGSLTHHATLRAAIAWSVDQLAAEDRALLGRLWPFEGGFSFEAANAVHPGPAPTIDTLSTLVSRSVVAADTTTTPTRYRLLQSVRAYAQDQDTRPESTRATHARWVRGLVDLRVAEFTTRRAGTAMRQLTRELPNLRAAIAYDLVHDPAAALRTVGRLNWFWQRGGHGGEAQRLLDAALRATPDATSLDLGHAHITQATSSSLPKGRDEVQWRYDEILACAAVVEDDAHRELRGLALLHFAMHLVLAQETEAAHEISRKTIEAGGQLSQEWLIAGGEAALGAALLQRGLVEQARETLRASIQRATRCGYFWAAGCAHLFLGWDIMRDTSSTAEPVVRGQLALAELQRAFTVYHHEADQFLSLAVLDTAAPALALLGDRTGAARLRAGARHHAEMLGVPAGHFTGCGAIVGDRQPLDPADELVAAPELPELTWSGMVGLLNAVPTSGAASLT